MNKKKDILQDLLKNPNEFLKAIGKIEGFKKEELFSIIEKSFYRDILQDFSIDEKFEIYQNFKHEINLMRDFILNSEIRTKTFYQLGQNEIVTVSEIAKIINKHPKSVSIYINDFHKRKWIEIVPDSDERKKVFAFTEQGLSYFKLAKKLGWFKKQKKMDSFEELILEISWHSFIINQIDVGLSDEISGEYDSEEISICIDEIDQIAKKIAEKFNISLELELRFPIGEREDLVSISSIDEAVIAIYFTAFNYYNKNENRWAYENDDEDTWSFTADIKKIRLISLDSYLDFDMPPLDSENGFLSEEETKAFIKKTLSNFREKRIG